MSGQFTLHRDVFAHELFEGEPFSRREAWIWLIGHAVWRDHVTTVRGQRVALKRGQIAVSLGYLAKRWLWTRAKVQRFLNTLARHDMIARDTPADPAGDTPADTAIKVITLWNYDKFQLQPGTADTAADPPADTGADPNKKSGDKKSGTQEGGRARGTRLPGDWTPGAAELEFARGEGLSETEIARETAKFRDHWWAQSGQHGRKRDWAAAYRNWIRRAVERGQPRAAGQHAGGDGSKTDGVVTAVGDLLSR